MNPLAVTFIGIGSALVGLVVGACIEQYISRAIAAENRELREGLRVVRGYCAGTSARGLTVYIDRLLGDEAA